MSSRVRAATWALGKPYEEVLANRHGRGCHLPTTGRLSTSQHQDSREQTPYQTSYVLLGDTSPGLVTLDSKEEQHDCVHFLVSAFGFCLWKGMPVHPISSHQWLPDVEAQCSHPSGLPSSLPGYGANAAVRHFLTPVTSMRLLRASWEMRARFRDYVSLGMHSQWLQVIRKKLTHGLHGCYGM